MHKHYLKIILLSISVLSFLIACGGGEAAQSDTQNNETGVVFYYNSGVISTQVMPNPALS